MKSQGALKSIVLALLAYGFFSTMDMMVKLSSGKFPLPQIIFCISATAMIPMAFLVKKSGGRKALATRRLGLHVLRGAIGLAGGFCSFLAYSRMPLTDAYAIAFSAPLFITALSVPFLGEHVGWRRWTAVTVGFLGVLVMLRPGQGVVGPGTVAAIGGTVAYASSVLLLSRMRSTETAAAQVFYPTLVSLMATGALMPFVFVVPSLGEVGLLLGMGLCGGMGQICLIEAFRRAQAAVVAPFQYTQMLWGAAYGYAFWADTPDGWTCAGAIIVAGSGLYILHRETVRRPSVTSAAKGPTGLGAPVLPDPDRPLDGEMPQE